MTATQKTILGIASFLPFALSIVLMIAYVAALSHLFQNAEFFKQPSDPTIFFRMYIGIFKSILIIAIPLLIISMALKIIFIILAVNNNKITEAERIIFILAFVLFGTVSYPIYFFLRVYGSQNTAASAVASLTNKN